MFLRFVLKSLPIWFFRFLTILWLFIENMWWTASSDVSWGIQKYYLLMTLISGIGSVMFMYGSNVTEIFLQSGHCKVDLYNPCIRSTIILWFLFKWFIQLSLEAATSSVPFDSSTGKSGLSFTLLRSSWRPSRRTESSSYESYYS